MSCQIAQFLLQDSEAPNAGKRKPSLNRAIHFIERDGFGIYEDIANGEKVSSHQTIKDEWSDTRSTSPFLLTWRRLADEGHFDYGFDLSCPAYPRFLSHYEYMRSSGLLLQFFQMAKFIAVRLETILTSVGVEVSWPSFPNWLEPLPVSFGPFSPEQRTILFDYKAPTRS